MWAKTTGVGVRGRRARDGHGSGPGVMTVKLDQRDLRQALAGGGTARTMLADGHGENKLS